VSLAGRFGGAVTADVGSAPAVGDLSGGGTVGEKKAF
jgi:hypothetical protein